MAQHVLQPSKDKIIHYIFVDVEMTDELLKANCDCIYGYYNVLVTVVKIC